MRPKRSEQRYLLSDFISVLSQGLYLHIPTGEWWTAEEVDAEFPPIPDLEHFDDETVH